MAEEKVEDKLWLEVPTNRVAERKKQEGEWVAAAARPSERLQSSRGWSLRCRRLDDDKDADPLLSDPGNDQRTNDRLVGLSLSIHTLYIRYTYAVHTLYIRCTSVVDMLPADVCSIFLASLTHAPSAAVPSPPRLALLFYLPHLGVRALSRSIIHIRRVQKSFRPPLPNQPRPTDPTDPTDITVAVPSPFRRHVAFLGLEYAILGLKR